MRFVPVVLDTTPPRAAITSSPPESTEDTDATFAFTADEPGSTFSCALDDTEPEPCTSPTTYTDLPVGEHTFSVAATDPAGNTGQATRSWTISPPPPPPDTTPPETTITSGPDAETADPTATFAFSADEPGSSFTCSLDGAAFTDCASPHTHTDLAVGVHTFSVAATDLAGNTDPTPALRAWTITAPPPPPTADCGPVVTLTATEDAWLDQNSSTTNKGSDSIIKVRSKHPRDNMRSLVRFTLPVGPDSCVVESATLRLYAASYTAGRTLQAYRVTNAWAENTVTWATQPSTTGPAASTASEPGWREWAVGPQVQTMSDLPAQHGFLLRDAVERVDREQQLHAREKGENPPQLVIRYAPAP